jgi:hypothetical protein
MYIAGQRMCIVEELSTEISQIMDTESQIKYIVTPVNPLPIRV